MERGDTGLGRDGFGLPRRRRPGNHRAYRGQDGSGPHAIDGPEDAPDDDYSHLRRRPGDMPSQPRFREPGYSPGPQPGFAPSRTPAGGYGPNGAPASGGPVNDGPINDGLINDGPVNGGLVGGGPVNPGPLDGGPASWGAGTGGPEPGGQYRLPNGRRVPPRAERPFRPRRRARRAERGASQVRGRFPARTRSAAAGAGYPGRKRPVAPRPALTAARRPTAGSPVRPERPVRPVRLDRWEAARRPGPLDLPELPGPLRPAEPVPREWVPVERVPAQWVPAEWVPGAGGPRADGRGSWGRLGAQAPAGGREGSGSAEREGPAGPVIRQRENAVPEKTPAATAQAAVSIAPDGLESFARDLRALRAQAQLDYPEMAEASHYEMKTLASAAGGLRLPTLPVAVAYVRACGGNLAEWEDRWQKLAVRITAEAAKKLRADGEDPEDLPEPADAPAVPELTVPPAPQEAAAEPGEIYVITSAKPRPPSRPEWYGGAARP